MSDMNNTDHPLYPRYAEMKKRCLNENAINYKNYGGRGIKIHPEWLARNDGFKSYVNLVESLENANKQGYSVDRIDNDGDYEPSNIKWSTLSDQAINRRPRSSHTGISWNKDKEMWTAYLYRKNRTLLFKRYRTKEEAIQARENALKDIGEL